MNPRVNICSALLQGSSYAGAFFHQIAALTAKGYELGTVTVTVDGETLSDATLLAAQADPRVTFVFEGPRGAPTCFMQERSVAWARTGNLALEKSLQTPSDYTLWIESDLAFPCDLIGLLIASGRDIVAPIVMLGENFYDSWGFRDLSGRRIATLAELQALPRDSSSLTELSSVGSCLLFKSSLLAQGIRMPSGYENGLLVGFCLAARARGARVFCRPDVVVVHPTSLWKEQTYRVTSCRHGAGDTWAELAPAGGAIVAGPFYDFVIPEAVRLVAAASAGPPEAAAHVAYATNGRREIAILVGDSRSLPPAPEGFGTATKPQPLPATPAAAPRKKSSWWKRLLSR